MPPGVDALPKGAVLWPVQAVCACSAAGATGKAYLCGPSQLVADLVSPTGAFAHREVLGLLVDDVAAPLGGAFRDTARSGILRSGGR